jgi:hypothetical protein
MPNTFRAVPPPWVPETPPDGPQDMPHGLITPPDLIRKWVAEEKAKFPAHLFDAEQEQRSLNDLTLQFYFESFNYDVLYRSTPDGPEVMAVGHEEIHAFTKDMPLEEQYRFNIWMP